MLIVTSGVRVPQIPHSMLVRNQKIAKAIACEFITSGRSIYIEPYPFNECLITVAAEHKDALVQSVRSYRQ